MKRAREEEDQDGFQKSENDASKIGPGDREELGKAPTTNIKLTDTNSNEMSLQKGDKLGLEEIQGTEDHDQVEQVEAMQLFDLPVEILRAISSFLDPASMKKARMVSQAMKEVIESPSLWLWATLKVNDLNHKEVLDSQVLHLVSGIRFRGLFPGSFPVPSLTSRLTSALLAGQFQQLVNHYCSCLFLRKDGRTSKIYVN